MLQPAGLPPGHLYLLGLFFAGGGARRGIFLTVWSPQGTAVVHLAADQELTQSLGNAAGVRVTDRTLNHSHVSITFGYDAVYLTPP